MSAYYSLLHLGRLSTQYRAFRPFHQNVKKAYKNKILPWIQSRLPQGFSLKVREGLLHNPDFNVFTSDLDLAIVFERESDEERLQECLDKIASLRRTFPFLGELEVYSVQEWNLKIKAEAKHQQIVKFVRSLRKLGWQEDAFKKAKTTYHRQKALQSIQAILDEIVPSDQRVRAEATGNLARISKWVERRLDEILPSIPDISYSWAEKKETDPWYSYYLQIMISVRPLEGALVLSIPTAVRLTACLPPGHDPLPLIDPWAKALRHNSQIGEIYKTLCLHEYVTCQSVMRVEGNCSREMRHWLESLRSELA